MRVKLFKAQSIEELQKIIDKWIERDDENPNIQSASPVTYVGDGITYHYIISIVYESFGYNDGE